MSIAGSISKWTALAINNDENDIRADAGQNKDNGLWVGFLCQYKDNDFHTILIHTQDTFPDKETAIAAVELILQKLRAMSVSEILNSEPQLAPANQPNPA